MAKHRSYSRWLRIRLTLSRWTRAVAAAVTRRFADTSRPGITSGSVERDRSAERALEMLTQSPAVYAGAQRRTLGLQRFPIQVYSQGSGGQVREVVAEKQALWVGSFLRLLQRPDAGDVGVLFPDCPGEFLLALLKLDRLVTGNAYVRAQRDPKGKAVVALARLHPRSVTIRIESGRKVYDYEPPGGRKQTFERGEVCHIRALPWKAGGHLGVGAATPLENVVAAEVAALDRTATAIEQGGVDVQAVASGDAAALQLSDPVARQELRDELTAAMSKDDSRIVVLGGVELKPLGLTPADIRAPELQKAARESELMALGVVPVAVGADVSAYATAAAQLRVQYGLDYELCTELEWWFLRPLAQFFAGTDPEWSGRASQVTAAYDLTTHEGALAARTEAIGRAEKLVGMGWSNDQANVAEQLGLPKAAGEPRVMAGTTGGAAPSSQAPAQLGGTPRPAQGEASRTLSWWDERAEGEPDGPSTATLAAVERALAWQRVEDGRAESDTSLRAGARQALDADRERYAAALDELLSKAWNGQGYDPIVWAALPDEDPTVYYDALEGRWRQTWADSAEGALAAEVGSTPAWNGASGAPLLDSSARMARTTRNVVLTDAKARVAAGEAPGAVVAGVRESWAFSADRDLGIARTETVRAQSLGEDARYARAVAEGVEMEQEWLSGHGAATRDDHAALDGVRCPIGGEWTFPDGVRTTGPGLSGKAHQDVNCRCARRAIILN